MLVASVRAAIRAASAAPLQCAGMRGAGLRGVRWSNQLPSHRLDDVSNTPDAPFDFTPENYGIVATILCVLLMGRRAAACGGFDRVIVLVSLFGAHACVASTASLPLHCSRAQGQVPVQLQAVCDYSAAGPRAAAGGQLFAAGSHEQGGRGLRGAAGARVRGEAAAATPRALRRA